MSKQATIDKYAKSSGISKGTLEKVYKRGLGAYYSSGSRPNQTGHSWGIARLASAITGGKAAAVDFNILKTYGIFVVAGGGFGDSFSGPLGDKSLIFFF